MLPIVVLDFARSSKSYDLDDFPPESYVRELEPPPYQTGVAE